MKEFAAREVGLRIAQARRERGLTQEQLATIGPFSKRSLQDYEAGITIPYRHLGEFSALLGSSVEWFLHGDRSPRIDEDRLARIEESLVLILRGIEDLQTLAVSELLPAIRKRSAQERLLAGK